MTTIEAIEEDIKQICKEFFTILQWDGLEQAEPNNFKLSIEGPKQLFDEKQITFEKLLEMWAGTYKARVTALQGHRYATRIYELTKRIYSDDVDAEHIVFRLKRLAGKEKKEQAEIINLFEDVKKQCHRLLEQKAKLEKLIEDLQSHGIELQKKSKTTENQKKIINEEEKTAEKYMRKLARIGRHGWHIVTTIYKEDKKAEHIFAKIKTHLQ